MPGSPHSALWLQTASSLFNFTGVQSLVMKVPASSAAARLVAANPGHPHIGLWLASGSLKPLIITIRPLWFSDSSAFYSFVPGELIHQSTDECLQTARMKSRFVDAPHPLS